MHSHPVRDPADRPPGPQGELTGPVPATLLELALAGTHEALIMLDQTGQVRYANHAALDLFRQADGDTPPLAAMAAYFASPETRQRLAGLDGQTHNGPATTPRTVPPEDGPATIRLADFALHLNSRSRRGRLSLTRAAGPDGGDWFILGFVDESGYRRLQNRLTRDEFYDRPSELLNQRAFGIMLEKELERASRIKGQPSLALMIVQLRNFETLKTIYPPETMDQVFGYLGTAVRNSLRSSDSVFRFDENRIVALVNGFSQQTDLLIIASRVEDTVGVPFHPQEIDIHLRSCIGIGFFPDDGNTSAQLIQNTLAALHHAMDHGLPAAIFNPEINHLATERLTIRSDLSRAVRDNQLELRYMPIVGPDRSIQGVEALVRWRHPQRGLLNPDQFLPVAIHSRIIGAITRWVLFRVIQDWETCLVRWSVPVSFNISAADLDDPWLAECICSAIEGHMPAAMLKVEITETECITHIQKAMEIMHALRDRGIRMALDDFGVGQSSLSNLRTIPASCAKIDQSFVRALTDNPGEIAFVSHMAALGHLRHLSMVAEGVETELQFQALKEAGVDLFQGFLFGEPMTLEDLVRLFPRNQQTV